MLEIRDTRSQRSHYPLFTLHDVFIDYEVGRFEGRHNSDKVVYHKIRIRWMGRQRGGPGVSNRGGVFWAS